MTSVEHWIGRAKALVPWSVPLKLALSSLLGVFGGAGLLGYLSEYATYSYAIHYGIRPPLEGIPYLRPAVAFGSLFLLLTGAAVFAAIALTLRLFVWYIDAVPRIAAFPLRLFGRTAPSRELHFGNALTQLRAKPLWQLLVACLLTAAAAVALVAVLNQYFGTDATHGSRVSILAFTFTYVFTVTIAVTRPSSVWWIAILVTVSYFGTCVYLLFTPQKYSDFLRVLGYGGGLTVTVELKDNARSSAFDGNQKHLMLRTSEALILFDKVNSTFSEIPKEQVHRLIHDLGGTGRLPYALPDRVNRWGDG